MSQEDKPVSEPRLVSYGLNMETCTLNLGGEEYYYDLKATTIDGVKPVAAQPVANAAPCARCKELENHIGNLLARIHRDGGHYQAEHGNEKAVADADIAVANAYVQITEQAAEIVRLRAENASLKEVISLSEDSRLMDEYLKLERANARQAERIAELEKGVG